MESPLIVVEDWAMEPPVTMRYINADHDLDFLLVYKAVRTLPSHPGRGALSIIYEGVGHKYALKPCTDDFLEHFFSCAGNLADYLAVFYPHDNAITQAVWLRLLDNFQIAAKLPHNILQTQAPVCSHAGDFSKAYDEVFRFINNILTNSHDPTSCRTQNVAHSFNMVTPRRPYLGAFKFGMKPWQQFLLNGSPGFCVEGQSRRYDIEEGMEFYAGESGEKKVKQVVVPMGALGIVQKHTERMRGFVKEMAVVKEQEGDNGQAMVARFDKNALNFEKPFIYTSISGQKTSVRNMYPSRVSRDTPRHITGYSDPSFFVRKPELWLLNEAVGMHVEHGHPFQHPAGNNEFRTWVVSVSNVKGEKGQKETKETTSN